MHALLSYFTHAQIIKAICGRTCAVGDTSVCAAIPDSGQLSITSASCNNIDFSHRNTTTMHIGTATLDISGDCCFDAFISITDNEDENTAHLDATSDFDYFDCTLYEGICDHPAYGTFMRAVCPETCGACMDELWVGVTQQDLNNPFIPALYDGQMSTDCDGVVQSTLLIFGTDEEFSTSNFGRGDECCDPVCTRCDMTMQYNVDEGVDYEFLTCEALSSHLNASCEQCACKLHHQNDENIIFPKFYCQNY